jgi:hypothetical protein
MANTYKVLGQQAPSATTNTTLYTVPSATSTVCSTLVVCNRETGTTFRVAVRPGGATISSEHYLAYDTAIEGFDTIFLTMGITLATTDVVTVYSTSGNVSFSLFGSELT